MNTKTLKSPSESLRFDPEKHQYFLGRKRIPGVSEILKKVGLGKDYEGIDPFYRDRGIATHKAIELYLKGTLDKSSLDPVIVPHFEAFLKFWNDRDEEIRALEKPLSSFDDSFAGTPDLITTEAVYDWKCSKSHDRVAELQGQAYKILTLGQMDLDSYPPFIVIELHDDGTFSEFNYGSDYEQWASVMALYRWRIGK